MDYYNQIIAGDQGTLPAYRYQEFHADTRVTAGSGFILHPTPFLMSPPIPAWRSGTRQAGSTWALKAKKRIKADHRYFLSHPGGGHRAGT